MIYVKKQPKICREIFFLARGYNRPPPMTSKVNENPDLNVQKLLNVHKVN
jgi:hypothetical protein